MPSKSIANRPHFGPSSDRRRPSASGRSPSPFSSSLSRRNGLGSFLFSTTRLSDQRGARLSAADWLKPCLLMPVSIEPRKYRYLPLASKTGLVASVKPSVIGNDLFCSSE